MGSGLAGRGTRVSGGTTEVAGVSMEVTESVTWVAKGTKEDLEEKEVEEELPVLPREVWQLVLAHLPHR